MKRSKKSQKSSGGTPLSHEGTSSSFVRAFLKRVQNTVALFRLWKSEKSFIVAVSGGPDSLCLLDVLYRLSKKYRLNLHVAHVNYRLRGKASDADERLVRMRAAEYGIECTVFRPKKKGSSSNLEERLRDERYAFFEDLRKRKEFDLIAVAHSEDDQAETLLLRLLRGSGLEGLSAILPMNGYVVRPLIQMSRSDIERYLDEQKLSYRLDASNEDRRFMRNRIRHQLIPLLERDFQPRVKRVLAQSALLIARDYADLRKREKKTILLGGDGAFSRVEALKLSDAALARELRALMKPFLSGRAPAKRLIDECIKVLHSRKSKVHIVSFRGLKFIRKGDTVTLLKSDS